jgi:hypothetical protein
VTSAGTKAGLMARVIVLAGALATLTVALGGGCSSPAPPSPSPSPLEEAFASSHPGGALPPGLKVAADTRLAAGELARDSGLDRALVPGWLPSGYELAAPYVSVGDGGALANPQVWTGGYRVSFTDGDGLIVVHVGDGRLPGEGTWRALASTWRGARLWRRESGGLVTVAARRRAVPVAVAVAGLPEAVAHRVLSGLRAVP